MTGRVAASPDQVLGALAGAAVATAAMVLAAALGWRWWTR